MAKKSISRSYWLLKSDSDCYGIDDLEREGSTSWDGVRNYQARNLMRDDMKVGDLALFYHSSSDPTGVAGIAEIVGAAHSDTTALDANDDHFDPKSTKENPIWMSVDVGFKAKFKAIVTLESLKKEPNLEGMMLLARGSRLSVQPVSEKHFKIVCDLAGWKPK